MEVFQNQILVAVGMTVSIHVYFQEIKKVYSFSIMQDFSKSDLFHSRLSSFAPYNK